MSAIFLYATRRHSASPHQRMQERVQIGLLVFAFLMTGLWHGLMPAYAQTCLDLLPDGSFEDGAGWTTQSLGQYSLLNTFHPRTGTQGAYLGGTNNAKDILSTNPALPGDHTITLSFWWQVHSEESSKDWDGLTVIVADVAGTPLRTLLTLSDADVTDLWQETTVDLSAYAGQVIQLQFAAQTDTTLVTDFFVDDVSLTACGQSTAPDTGTDVSVETDTATNVEADANNNPTPTDENGANAGDNPEGTPDPNVDTETTSGFEFYLPLLRR